MPARSYYGGAPNAFAGGAMFQKDVRTREHQDNALNALIQRFGPEAGDPTAWGQVQAIDQREQMFPHQIAEQEHRARMRPYEIRAEQHLEKTRPYEINDLQRRDDAFNDLTGRFGPAAGDPTAHGIEQEELQVLRSSALSAARVLQTAKAKGGDLGAAYDMATSVLRGLGLPDEAIAGFREQIISDPDFVDEFVAMLSGVDRQGAPRGLSGGRAFRDPDTGEIVFGIPMDDGSVQIATDSQGRPMLPVAEELAERRADQGAERIDQGWQRITLEQARMEGYNAPEGHQIWRNPETGEIRATPIPGTEQDRASQDRDRRLTAEEHAARQAAQEQVQIAELALNSLENTRTQMKRWGTVQGGSNNWSSGIRAFQGLPGIRSVTDVGRFMEEIQTLKAHVAIDRLAAIKATGATLGQITERELTLLENSMGNLSSPSRDPELIRKDLDIIERIMTEAKERAEGALQMELRYPSGGQGTPAPSGGAGAPPPPAGGDWRARARQLESEGHSPAEITQILRQEGLIAGGGQ